MPWPTRWGTRSTSWGLNDAIDHAHVSQLDLSCYRGLRHEERLMAEEPPVRKTGGFILSKEGYGRGYDRPDPLRAARLIRVVTTPALHPYLPESARVLRPKS